MPDVEAVQGWVQADFTVFSGSSGEASTFSITPRNASVQPALVEGAEPAEVDDLVVSVTAAAELGLALGDEVETDHIRQTSSGQGEGVPGTARVVGLYDDTTAGIDGPAAVYATEARVLTVIGDSVGHDQAWMDANYGFPKAYATLASAEAVPGFVDDARAAGFSPTSLASLLTGLPATQRFLEGLRPVLGILLGVLLIVVG